MALKEGIFKRGVYLEEQLVLSLSGNLWYTKIKVETAYSEVEFLLQLWTVGCITFGLSLWV